MDALQVLTDQDRDRRVRPIREARPDPLRAVVVLNAGDKSREGIAGLIITLAESVDVL